MFFILVHVTFLAADALKFAIYYGAASLPSQASYAVLAKESLTRPRSLLPVKYQNKGYRKVEVGHPYSLSGLSTVSWYDKRTCGGGKVWYLSSTGMSRGGHSHTHHSNS